MRNRVAQAFLPVLVFASTAFAMDGTILNKTTGEPQPVMPDGFAEKPPENSIVEFLRSRDGLELNKAFVRISDAKARRAIVDLVRSLANDDTNDNTIG